MDKKIKSVIETSRLKIGDTVYKLTLRYKKAVTPVFEQHHEYLQECHPKEMYIRGPLKRVWDRNKRLPKLHHVDFHIITNLIASDLVVDEFIVNDIIRSNHTGEFIYQATTGEWMPESCLFDSSAAALQEKVRIERMVSKWP